MTSAARPVPWSERLAIARRAASVALKGGALAIQLAAVASGTSQDFQSGNLLHTIIATALADKTWSDISAMAATADKALASGDLMLSVVRDHGRNIQNDVKLGLELAQAFAPKIASSVSTFLGGPLGGLAMGVFTFWLTGLLTGTPHNSGQDGIGRLPEGGDWQGEPSTPPSA